MTDRLIDSNAVFKGSHVDERWIELYHSRPSWSVCQISLKKNGESWVPFGSLQFIDASNIRPGFRVFRTKAESLEFRLANKRTATIDSNSGRNYHVKAPGRYVVESGNGCRRISEAQISDCLRATRPADQYVEILFEPSRAWRNCFITYASTDQSQDAWHKIPMLPSPASNTWHQRMQSIGGISFAFHDGGGMWDNNGGHNYDIPLPGKYHITRGTVGYQGVAEADVSL